VVISDGVTGLLSSPDFLHPMKKKQEANNIRKPFLQNIVFDFRLIIILQDGFAERIPRFECKYDGSTLPNQYSICSR
jgi:hypothetical protein